MGSILIVGCRQVWEERSFVFWILIICYSIFFYVLHRIGIKLRIKKILSIVILLTSFPAVLHLIHLHVVCIYVERTVDTSPPHEEDNKMVFGGGVGDIEKILGGGDPEEIPVIKWFERRNGKNFLVLALANTGTWSRRLFVSKASLKRVDKYTAVVFPVKDAEGFTLNPNESRLFYFDLEKEKDIIGIYSSKPVWYTLFYNNLIDLEHFHNLLKKSLLGHEEDGQKMAVGYSAKFCWKADRFIVSPCEEIEVDCYVLSPAGKEATQPSPLMVAITIDKEDSVKILEGGNAKITEKIFSDDNRKKYILDYGLTSKERKIERFRIAVKMPERERIRLKNIYVNYESGNTLGIIQFLITSKWPYQQTLIDKIASLTIGTLTKLEILTIAGTILIIISAFILWGWLQGRNREKPMNS